MFRTTIRVDERADVSAVAQDLRARCERAGIQPPIVDDIERQMRDILSLLVQRGRELATSGSKMSVTRDVAGEGYAIRLEFGAGKPPSLLSKLIALLRGN